MPATSNTTATSKAHATPTGQTSSKEALKPGIVKRKPVHKPQPIQNRPQPIQNRVKVLLVHIPRLSIQGQARLAAEVGVSRSTISRLVHGRINPSYRLARGVTDVLERMLGKPLDMREVFSTDGTYLTASGCALCRCHGCLPETAWDEDGYLKPGWEGARPGDWSLARANTPELAWENRPEEPSEKEPNEEEPNGGFSGYGEAEDGDEEALAEHWEAKRKSAKLNSVTPSSAKRKEAPRSDR